MTEPIHIISLGAGVQSSCMAMMAAKEMLSPMPVAAIFADTQAEPKSVYTWLDWLEKQLPFPVIRVTQGSLERDTLVLHERKDKTGHWIHSGIPHYSINSDGSKGHGPRQCTHDYKITPIMKQVRSMVISKMTQWRRDHKDAVKEIAAWNKAVRLARRQKAFPPMRQRAAWDELQSDPLVIQWIGISTDEASRMKESKLGYIKNIWPLIEGEISRKQCLEWFTLNNLPKPPRSACVFCPYHSDKEWLRLKTEEPDEFERAVRFEREYQRLKVQTVSKKGFFPYLHDSRTPLDQVDFRTEQQRGQEMLFNNECEGMCGV